MNKVKEGTIKFAKWAGGLACVIIGLAIGGFGVAQFIPEKKYGGGDVTVRIPEKEAQEK